MNITAEKQPDSLAIKQKNESFLAFAVFLATLIAAHLAIMVLGNWLGVSLIDYAPVAGALIAAGITYGYFFPASNTNVIIAALLSAVLFAAGVASQNMPDFTMDGISYHQPMVEAIVNGWNPIRDGNASIWQQDIYPSGAWTVEACLVKVYGSVESGKALQLWWLFMVIPVLLAGLRNTLGQINIYHYMLVWLLALSPVVLGQMLTYYVDALVYLEGLLMFGAVMLMGNDPRRNRLALWLMMVSLCFLITTKLSGLWYGAMGCAGVLLYLYQQEGKINRKLAGQLFATGVFAVVVLGYHPYVTSMVKYGSLFPWDPAGLAADAMPTNYKSLPVPLRFVYSLFTVTGAAAGFGKPAVFKWPWVVYESEWLQGSPAHVSGAFGPLFALALLFSMVVCAACFWKRGAGGFHKGILALAVTLFLFSLFFPEGWWMRWAPFAYAVPFFLLFSLRRNDGVVNAVMYLIAALFFINSMSAMLGALRTQAYFQADFIRAVRQIRDAEETSVYLVPEYAGDNYRKTTQAYRIIGQRLEAEHIHYDVKPDAACEHKVASWAEFDVCY